MSILSVIGPVIIGPSSSHTAGAARIGKFAYNYLGGTPEKVTFILHGSFADTYFGHGTDRALLGGLMGFEVDDIRIRDAFKIADSINLEYEFICKDLGDVHPNTLKILAFKENKEFEIIACSVGGGEVMITSIDGSPVKLDGKSPTIAIVNQDVPGAVYEIMKIISKYHLNVANMHLLRTSRILQEASCIIELDMQPDIRILDDLKSLECVISCRYISELL